MHRYNAFGFEIASNLPIPELVERASSRSVDITIWVGLCPAVENDQAELWMPYGKTLEFYSDRQIFRYCRSGILHFRFSDETHFYVSPDGREIWTQWVAPFTSEDMATYLLGPIMGYILRLHSLVALHASSVLVDGRAVAFIGPGGAGKSTTAASFAMRGHAVLADDVSAIEVVGGRFMVRPSYPHLRLWPDSAQALVGDAEALSPITPNWDKRDFPLCAAQQFATAAADLEAVYILAPREDNALAPFIEPITLQSALLELIGNTYSNVLLDPGMRANEFSVLSGLVGTVSIKRIVRKESLDDLEQVYRAILNDLTKTETNGAI